MDSDPESMDLFFLLGMLPGGISPRELDHLWHKITQVSKKSDDMESKKYDKESVAVKSVYS
jgi:hypothetical protein